MRNTTALGFRFRFMKCLLQLSTEDTGQGDPEERNAIAENETA